MSEPVSYRDRPPTAQAALRRGIAFALRSILAAERELPPGPEKDEVSAWTHAVILAIRALEKRLLAPFPSEACQ